MWIVILITACLLALCIRLCFIFQDKIKFIIKGQDEGFTFSESLLLWKLAKAGAVENPAALFYSVPSLSAAIASYASSIENGEPEDNSSQNFLSKLYEYRTKIDIEHENKRGLDSSKYLEKGQKLKIILKGKGVFTSEILNNGREIAVKLPLQKNTLRLTGEEWAGKNISVYLWRKKDAGYVFDTRVIHSGIFQGQNVIYLAQSSSLERTQKRRSVRSECDVQAQLYFISEENTDFTAIEVEPGYRCILEDISQDGAMVRVGGRGEVNAQIKLQFDLDGKLIVMFGVVRAVEFNRKINQSRLHFECLHIEKDMKNTVLSYVYKIVPDEKKEILDAMALVEAEEKAEKRRDAENASVTEKADTAGKTDNALPAENENGDDKKQKENKTGPKNTLLPGIHIDTDELAKLDVEDFGV